MKVNIPFKERFREPMLNGTKTMTSRSKRYGNVGDTFDAFEQEFEFVAVFKMELQKILMEWKREGFESLGDCQLTWCQIHPKRKYDDLTEKFWVHLFKKR